MVIGKRNPENGLSEKDALAICGEAFANSNFENKRLLIIIPDNTRTAPVDMMFRIVYKLLFEQVQLMDFIIALGTHLPLSEESIYARVGITRDVHRMEFPKARFFNHAWNDKTQLKSLGVISDDEVFELSGGMMRQHVDVTINKMVFDYDLLMIIGPVFPHEVVGFSGGNKYLFPGIAGEEIIDMFHWLGALITNSVIIGNQRTPVREVIDKAASMLSVDKICLSLVVKEKKLAGLFIGTPEESQAEAAELSNLLHITYKDKAFHRVLSCAPKMYEDIWTAGKCMYKIEPVVADGGELIIYAPHIEQVCLTHGAAIEEIGYHVRDYFLKQMDQFEKISGGVMAHSTHVKGGGTFVDGIEKPRINVVLATQIPEQMCRKINLGYRDPNSIIPAEWADREEDGILYVEKAGEMLYRLID